MWTKCGINEISHSNELNIKCNVKCALCSENYRKSATNHSTVGGKHRNLKGMALEYLAWDWAFLSVRVHRLNQRIERRTLRDAQNPFELPDDEFLEYFRLKKETASEIIESLRVHLMRERKSGLKPEIQVLIAIRFYAHGSYQRSIGRNFEFAVCQSTVSRCIHAVTEGINNYLLRKWVKYPMTAEERQSSKSTFAQSAQPFEGAMGAIDCTFIAILAPPSHEEAYINHHGNHSLNVQVIVDAKTQVLNVNARYPGARNDSYIWSSSPIRDVMEYWYKKGDKDTWLIGDAGYPLEPWLMTPLPHYAEDTREFKYTEALCKARNVVERFFGKWKATWRCLSYQRVLMYDPAFAGKIVNACAVLHNMRLKRNTPEPEGTPKEPSNDQYRSTVPTAEGTTSRVIARRRQQRLMAKLFPDYPSATHA